MRLHGFLAQRPQTQNRPPAALLAHRRSRPHRGDRSASEVPGDDVLYRGQRVLLQRQLTSLQLLRIHAADSQFHLLPQAEQPS